MIREFQITRLICSKQSIIGMRKCKLLLIIFSLSLVVSCSSDDEKPLVEEVMLNVSYGGNSQQKADIYLPADRSESTTKVIILIHGGGWAAGDKSDMTGFVDYLKDKFPDCAFVNMNYRLATATSAGFPKQTDDISKLITFLKNSDYNIDNEYAMIGTSAGGHLSLLYSYVFDPDHEVKAVCNIVGPVDFTDPAYVSENYYPGFDDLIHNLIGNYDYEENPEKYIEVSPSLLADNDSPPTLSFYGELDPLVPPSQHYRFMESLTAKGVVHESTLYEGVGHGDFTAEQYGDLANQLVGFFNDHLIE